MPSTFFPDGKEIEIFGEKIKIKPFVLRNRLEVIKLLADILLSFGKVNPGMDISKLGSEEEIKKAIAENPDATSNLLSGLISSAGDKIVRLYEIATGKENAFLQENLTLRDEIVLLQAITEVNDIPFLLGQVGSLIKGLRNQGRLS